MSPHQVLALSTLLVTTMPIISVADTNAPASTNGFTLTLRLGKGVAVTQSALQPLYSKAVELLESSNFNSRAPRWEWNIGEVLEGYRTLVSGKYFVVSFREPRRIKTVGGEISVREIAVGLNRPDLAGPLYTIDDEERIVAHSKYSGPLCVDFMQSVKKIIGEHSP